MWLNSFTWPLSYCSALLPINGKGKQIIFQLLLGNWYISCLATDALFNPCFSISAQFGLIRSAVIESADGGLNCPNYQLLTYELMIMNLNWDDSERPRPAGDVTAPLISYLLCSKWGIFVNSTWIERNTFIGKWFIVAAIIKNPPVWCRICSIPPEFIILMIIISKCKHVIIINIEKRFVLFFKKMER